MQRFVFLMGLTLISAFFILAGINKVLNQSETLAFMQNGGLPASSLLLWLVIITEIGGGAALWIKGRIKFLVAIGLAGFTLLTNIIFHNFWAMDGTLAQTELALFFKNMAIIGGLLLIAANGVGNKA